MIAGIVGKGQAQVVAGYKKEGVVGPTGCRAAMAFPSPSVSEKLSGKKPEFIGIKHWM